MSRLPDQRHVFSVLILAGTNVFETEGGKVGPEDGGGWDLMVDIFEEVLYIGGEW